MATAAARPRPHPRRRPGQPRRPRRPSHRRSLGFKPHITFFLADDLALHHGLARQQGGTRARARRARGRWGRAGPTLHVPVLQNPTTHRAFLSGRLPIHINMGNVGPMALGGVPPPSPTACTVPVSPRPRPRFPARTRGRCDAICGGQCALAHRSRGGSQGGGGRGRDQARVSRSRSAVNRHEVACFFEEFGLYITRYHPVVDVAILGGEGFTLRRNDEILLPQALFANSA